MIHCCAPFLAYGGAEKQFRYLVIALEELGFDVMVHALASSASGASIDWPSARPRRSKCRIYGVNPVLRGNGIWNIPGVLIALTRIALAVKRGDCVYAYSAYLLPILPFAWIRGGRVIYSERLLTSKLVGRSWLYSLLRFARTVVVNSDSLKEFFSGDRSVTLIHNVVEPVDWSQSTPRDLESVAIVARYDREKNIAYALKELGAEPGPRVTIYGEPQDRSYHEELERLAADLPAEIVLEGRVSIGSIYNANDLVVLPTLAEGASNVILEAMASRKLILASDIRENKDLGIDSRCLFDANRPGALKERFTWLREQNEDVWREILESNKRRVTKRHSWKRFVSDIDCLFRRECEFL